MRRLLVLRPEPGASATVERARDCGLDAASVPLFEVEPVAWEAPDATSFQGLLLTSANAVRHAGEQLRRLRGLKVYAVGEATAEAAREAGFDIAASGDSGVNRLLGSIEPDLKLLHLCGENRRAALSALQQITPIVVYRAKEIAAPDLSMAEGCAALIHSPRAALRFAELIDERETITVAALSREVANAAGRGWKAVEIAEQPTDDALLALAATLCNKPDPE